MPAMSIEGKQIRGALGVLIWDSKGGGGDLKVIQRHTYVCVGGGGGGGGAGKPLLHHTVPKCSS